MPAPLAAKRRNNLSLLWVVFIGYIIGGGFCLELMRKPYSKAEQVCAAVFLFLTAWGFLDYARRLYRFYRPGKPSPARKGSGTNVIK